MLAFGVSVINRQGSAAIINEMGELIAEKKIETNNSLSISLVPTISTLLKENSVKVDDINLLAITNGPGSFTSLRIGLAAMKGLFFGSNAKQYGISSLKVIAANVLVKDGIVIPMIDAKKAEIYCGVFKVQNNQIEVVRNDYAASPEETIPELMNRYPDAYFIGDGYEKYQNLFPTKPHTVALKNSSIAYEVAKFGLYEFHKKKKDQNKLSLNYCRKSEAEVNKNITVDV
ncbi:MAG: tRNA (adenosine(37)-N6)-threonylcarbamoyltransferase complex dimerization subunit type 1 TsaB [Nitrospinae bacterium]|nr:tRNA (adenosine(37)-N6)-threonylcarbamoyltransferase complex dimerization subunit type 1 TsaB [Nitrospinota bacterium]